MAKPQLTQRNEVFNQQTEVNIVRSRYDLSERHTGSFRMGALYPIYCRNDIVPGDRFSINCAPFVRFLPLVAPALTNVDVEIRFFFVPYRLLWNDWKKYISPSESSDLLLEEPGIFNGWYDSNSKRYNIFNVAGSLYDYMGAASINWSKDNISSNYGQANWHNPNGFGHAAPFKIIPQSNLGGGSLAPIIYSGFPFAAYNFIWNEYFRDENLETEAPYKLNAGAGVNVNPTYNFFVRRVNWEKDYFSSALPFVTQQIFATPTITAGSTIDTLREASALTKWLEHQAVGGHRYQESILTHFGVRVPDEAAQIPVYLGGGKCPISVGSVEQTAPAIINAPTKLPSVMDTTPLATLGGKATGSDSFFVDNVEFKEHGVVLGLMYIRPKALYADVTSRDLFKKSDRWAHYWPDFANLGDEAVSSNELNPGFGDNSHSSTDFGYQMRFASYRTSFDRVHGQLRPTESLESWTQARSWVDYSDADLSHALTPLQINSDFIECKPSNRIFAVEASQQELYDDNIIGEITTFVDATRPMPNYVDPKID